MERKWNVRHSMYLLTIPHQSDGYVFRNSYSVVAGCNVMRWSSPRKQIGPINWNHKKKKVFRKMHFIIKTIAITECNDEHSTKTSTHHSVSHNASSNWPPPPPKLTQIKQSKNLFSSPLCSNVTNNNSERTSQGRCQTDRNNPSPSEEEEFPICSIIVSH